MDTPLLPQRATCANADVQSVDWLFEPCWPGQRLIARIDGEEIRLTDAHGEPSGDELLDAAGLLRAAVTARQAIIDGVWTAQPFLADDDPARRAFVAVDLVELDGASLIDVPFQERRRLLESVIDEGVEVRVSPAVRQPIGGWVVGWRANGFTHYVAKHMNSRYEPGTRSDEWLKIPTRDAPQHGFVARLLGSREKVRRISD
jgi:bifunctional non-homologous end joining protein LigD